MMGDEATRVCRHLMILGLLAILAGCGGASRARASVKGKVTFEGKNLTVGNVIFYASNNQSASGAIDKEGNYVIPDAPLGDVKIAVMVPKMPPGGLSSMKGGPAMKEVKDAKSVDPTGSGKSISIMGDMPSHVVPIPPRYELAETSGLTYKVERGEHVHDLVLTP